MCEKKYLKQGYCNPRIDSCLSLRITYLKSIGLKTLASCCGHDKYPMTIVVKNQSGKIYDFFSNIELGERKRNRYYKKDNEGYYYIPEVGSDLSC